MASMLEFVVHAKERSASRRTVRLGCEVVRTRDYSMVGKKMIDLSTDGLQVIADGHVTVGEDVEVFFRVPYSNIYVLSEGRVARVIRGHRPGDEGPAYGIKLAPLHEDAKRALAAASLRFPPTLPWRARRIDYAATVRQISLS